MAEFSRLVITNKGQALLAKMMTGEADVEFTKISVSDKEYTLEELNMLTELTGVKQTAPVAKITRTNNVAITIETSFDNTELTQGYYMRALGLYAIDPDDGEILYAVTTELAGCCYMPAYNGITISGACIKLVTTVGNAENVSLEVDPGVYATVGEIKELRECVDGIETWKDNTQKRLDNWGPTIVGHGQVINSLRDSIGNLKSVATSGDYNDLANRPDLKPVAMSGSYNDLTNKPSIPAAVRVKGNTEFSYRTGDVNLTPENIGALNKSGDTIEGDLTVLGSLNGEENTLKHSILLGNNGKNCCDFYEYGGLYNFYKGSPESRSLLGKITSNGWQGDVTTSNIKSLNNSCSKIDFAEEITTYRGEDYYVGDSINLETKHSQYEKYFNASINIIPGCECTDNDHEWDIKYCEPTVRIKTGEEGLVALEAGEYGNIYLKVDNTQIGLSSHRLYPCSDAVISLGTETLNWKNIYSVNGIIQTSDRNKKNAMVELDPEKARAFIYGLKPSTYKMNAGTSGRIHWGLISQDIEELFEEIGMTSLDFAGFIKSPKIQRITEDENGKELQKPIEKVIEGEYDYSLRYDEFIAPIIKVIQSQHEEIETLKQETAVLKRQLSDLMKRETV